ncbi:MAG: hypothetical protein HZB55_07590 [Deltaproteobacteria bacterium]|nr:hypothetical protein [Deltaproteobacteria bacterium]
MTPSLIVRVACLFVLVAAAETLNGIARTMVLNRRLGVRKAKRVSLASALLLCLAICYGVVPGLGLTTDAGLLALGVSLSAFMLLFDVLLTRYVARASLSAVLDDLNLMKGNLLALGLVAMAFCPLIASKIPRPW